MVISKRNFAAVLILSLFCCSGYVQAQTAAESIDEYMHYCYENDLFNGAGLVAESGSVIYKKGFGLADMEWEIRNTPDTKFRLGSITKQFTSMLIMQLVEQGNLDKAVEYYAKSLQMNPHNTNAIRMLQSIQEMR